MMGQIGSCTDEKRGGSEPGNRRNVSRAFGKAHERYMIRYFWSTNSPGPGTTEDGPTQTEWSLERRFRIPRTVFNKLSSGVCSANTYFTQGLSPDAVGNYGIFPLIKILTEWRKLAYGIPAGLCYDLFDVSGMTDLKKIKEF